MNYSFGSLHYVFRKAIGHRKRTISQAKSILILGFGAGSIAKILRNELCLNCEITGVDFEPKMLDIAKKHSGIRDFDTLKLYASDASAFLEQHTFTYDLIFIDLFIEDQMPTFCLEYEFLAQISNALSPNGTVIWNSLNANIMPDEKLHKIFTKIEILQVSKDNKIYFLM